MPNTTEATATTTREYPKQASMFLTATGDRYFVGNRKGQVMRVEEGMSQELVDLIQPLADAITLGKVRLNVSKQLSKDGKPFRILSIS